MRRVIVFLALLLLLSAAAVGRTGWKWESPQSKRPVAGWTWDDAALLWVYTSDSPCPVTEGEAVCFDQVPQVTESAE